MTNDDGTRLRASLRGALEHMHARSVPCLGGCSRTLKCGPDAQMQAQYGTSSSRTVPGPLYFCKAHSAGPSLDDHDGLCSYCTPYLTSARPSTSAQASAQSPMRTLATPDPPASKRKRRHLSSCCHIPTALSLEIVVLHSFGPRSSHCLSQPPLHPATPCFALRDHGRAALLEQPRLFPPLRPTHRPAPVAPDCNHPPQLHVPRKTQHCRCHDKLRARTHDQHHRTRQVDLCLAFPDPASATMISAGRPSRPRGQAARDRRCPGSKSALPPLIGSGIRTPAATEYIQPICTPAHSAVMHRHQRALLAACP